MKQALAMAASLLAFGYAVAGCAATATIAIPLPTPVTVETKYTVVLAEDGAATVNGQPVEAESLVGKLRALGAGQADGIDIRASDRIRHGDLVKVLSQLKSGGFSKIAIAAVPE